LIGLKDNNTTRLFLDFQKPTFIRIQETGYPYDRIKANETSNVSDIANISDAFPDFKTRVIPVGYQVWVAGVNKLSAANQKGCLMIDKTHQE